VNKKLQGSSYNNTSPSSNLDLRLSFQKIIIIHETTHKTQLTTMASSTAQRRLLQEYRALTNNPPEGITAGPVSEDDLLYWEALIQGPEGTPFEGGVFPAELKFPKDYPLAPPSMRFLGEVWHPNGMFPARSGHCRMLHKFSM
jgi:hypothetical protein